jgi:hypothetical protein
MKDILQPVNTTQSSSPSITHAAMEPANWRAQGQTDVQQAVKDNPTKNPICPKSVTK